MNLKSPQGVRRIAFITTLLAAVHSAMMAQAAMPTIVINEIMYHPPNDLSELQYVELFNRGTGAVSLAGCSFSRGVSFTFPADAQIQPGQFLVVCRDLNAFSRHYTNSVHAIGNFSGSLSHHGEKLELADPAGKVIDAVKYSDHAPWPLAADGFGSSLERICPDAKSNEAENWSASPVPRLRVAAGTPGRENSSFSPKLPPRISHVKFAISRPGEPVTVTARVREADGITNVTLLFRTVGPRREGTETEVRMQRGPAEAKGITYAGMIPAQTNGSLVRFRIRATDGDGTERLEPSPHDLRPSYSYYCGANTNSARIPFGFAIQVGPPEKRLGFRKVYDKDSNPEPALGTAAFIYMPANSTEVETFDHVRLQPRSGGFKVHFQKDKTLRGMTGINVIFEGSPRYVLAEPLGYELFRMAGVPAERTEHIRIWRDGRPMGYQLLIEQPNKEFLARAKRNDNGNLYKLLWYGQSVIEKHEKKTHESGGHKDLLELLAGLETTSGTKQWEFIQKNFNVAEVVGYFAVSMCIQNWDGLHNNYFAYHDTEGTGKWEMIPWDLDKTWGDYDGSPIEYDWYEMPLTYGMAGDVSPPADPQSRHNHQGQFGGVDWWRRGGYFSEPLLANPAFRKVFRERLRELCRTQFTPQNFGPLIDDLERRLEPEIEIRAAIRREPGASALNMFKGNIESLRNQLKHRREFILTELDKN